MAGYVWIWPDMVGYGWRQKSCCTEMSLWMFAVNIEQKGVKHPKTFVYEQLFDHPFFHVCFKNPSKNCAKTLHTYMPRQQLWHKIVTPCMYVCMYGSKTMVKTEGLGPIHTYIHAQATTLAQIRYMSMYVCMYVCMGQKPW